jgi:hypothetical protein
MSLAQLVAAHHAALKTGNGLIQSLQALAAHNNQKGKH